MPDGLYFIKTHGELGESELYWVIENDNHSSFLLACNYWHPGIEQEIAFYQKNKFNIKRPILRKSETLQIPEDANNPIKKYLYYDLYTIFELQ